uniref:Amidase domain-containing protein n=1 Tax=Sexangularia sp. CB-2014 TaxID=1486929 RepID=A0A7S1VHN1_9EUKA
MVLLSILCIPFNILSFIFSVIVAYGPKKSVYAKLKADQRGHVAAARSDILANLDTKSVAKIIAAIQGPSPVRSLREAIQTNAVTADQVRSYLSAAAILAEDELTCLADTSLLHAPRTTPAAAASSSSGPLGGIPVSVKDNFHLPGNVSTIGVGKNCEPVSTVAGAVAALEAAGAVPFVKTNVSQTLMLPESANPVYGVACNPFNVKRTPGGSSGGEGALVGAGASVVGLGTDIGGSVRIPAHFCGVVGFKPTSSRQTGMGLTKAFYGQEAIASSVGFLSQRVEGVRTAAEAVCNNSVDPTQAPIPFDSAKASPTRRLRVGYYDYDQWFPASAALQRAVRETVDALEEHGESVDVKPIEPIDTKALIGLYYGLVSADGLKLVRETIWGEQLVYQLRPTLLLGIVPSFVRTLVAFVLRLLGQTEKAWVVSHLGEKRVCDVWTMQHARANMRRDWANHLEVNDVDVVLCPTLSFPAFVHGGATNLLPSLSYTFLANLLDLPAGSVPVTTVTAADAHSAPPRPAGFAGPAAQQEVDSEGLPVGVQLVGRPHDDETVLCAMDRVERALDAATSSHVRCVPDLRRRIQATIMTAVKAGRKGI